MPVLKKGKKGQLLILWDRILPQSGVRKSLSILISTHFDQNINPGKDSPSSAKGNYP